MQVPNIAGQAQQKEQRNQQRLIGKRNTIFSLANQFLEKSSVDVLSLTQAQRLELYGKALCFAEEFATVANEYLSTVNLVPKEID